MLRDNIQGITKSAIRRLCRRGGVKRISGLIYEETRGVLKIFLENTIRDSVTYTEHARRKTVTALDVVMALKRQGKTIYGFGDMPVTQSRGRRGENPPRHTRTHILKYLRALGALAATPAASPNTNVHTGTRDVVASEDKGAPVVYRFTVQKIIGQGVPNLDEVDTFFGKQNVYGTLCKRSGVGWHNMKNVVASHEKHEFITRNILTPAAAQNFTLVKAQRLDADGTLGAIAGFIVLFASDDNYHDVELATRCNKSQVMISHANASERTSLGTALMAFGLGAICMNAPGDTGRFEVSLSLATYTTPQSRQAISKELWNATIDSVQKLRAQGIVQPAKGAVVRVDDPLGVDNTYLNPTGLLMLYPVKGKQTEWVQASKAALAPAPGLGGIFSSLLFYVNPVGI